jgi:hypothetical protein
MKASDYGIKTNSQGDPFLESKRGTRYQQGYYLRYVYPEFGDRWYRRRPRRRNESAFPWSRVSDSQQKELDTIFQQKRKEAQQ